MKITNFCDVAIGTSFYLPNDLKGKTGRAPVRCTKITGCSYVEENNARECVTLNPRIVIGDMK